MKRLFTMGARGSARLTAILWAFARRNLAVYASYRAKLSLGVVSLLVSLVTFSFVGKVVATAGNGFDERYGMSYVSFVIVGVLVHGIAAAGLHAFRAGIRREQLQGTLELLVATRSRVPVLLLLSGMAELVVAAAGGAALLGLAALVLEFRLPVSPSFVAAVALYAIAMCGLGLASAGLVLVTKEGDPVSWGFATLAGLLGGVYFPIDLLPAWLRKVSLLLPTTHALRVARAGLSDSGPSSPLASSLTVLALSAAGAVAAGLLVLRWGYRRARRDGTLGQY
jgi:ABC-2 type transport system permease protein